MTVPPNNSGLRDNYSRGNVADFLRSKIREGSQLSIVSAYFTIYAYDALKSCLNRIDHLDFLFGEPSFVSRLDPDKTQKKAFIIDADGLELANKLQQKRVARECAEWIESKVDIKTITRHVDNLLRDPATGKSRGEPSMSAAVGGCLPRYGHYTDSGSQVTQKSASCRSTSASLADAPAKNGLELRA